MKTESNITTSRALQLWIGIGFAIWVAFGASFGAAGDFLANPQVTKRDIIAIFVVAPVVSLTWPLWVWLAIKCKLL